MSGFLLQKELDYLDGAVADPKKPFAAIVGGSKVSTKITVIESLLEKAQKVRSNMCAIPRQMVAGCSRNRKQKTTGTSGVGTSLSHAVAGYYSQGYILIRYLTL